MTNPHMRRKRPQQVRRALLDQATRLAARHGLGAVTMQAVADAAGVTKGGFTHHFPSKQALIDAVFDDLLAAIEADLQARIKADDKPQGAFTRAYVGAVFDMKHDEASPWVALSISILTDADLRRRWSERYAALLAAWPGDEHDLRQSMVRLAADGMWLADLVGTPLPQREQLRDLLLYEAGANSAPD